MFNSVINFRRVTLFWLCLLETQVPGKDKKKIPIYFTKSNKVFLTDSFLSSSTYLLNKFRSTALTLGKVQLKNLVYFTIQIPQ